MSDCRLAFRQRRIREAILPSVSGRVPELLPPESPTDREKLFDSKALLFDVDRLQHRNRPKSGVALGNLFAPDRANEVWRRKGY